MRKIILSKRASNRLNQLLEYLETEWSLKVKNDFIKKLEGVFKKVCHSLFCIAHPFRLRLQGCAMQS